MNTSTDTRPPRSGYWADAGVFLWSWLRSPGKTGAVLPSSSYLAAAMSEVLTGYEKPTVAELGPGTGALTAGIQQRLAGNGRHVAVELNGEFAERLALRFPQVEVVNDSAADLVRLLTERGVGKVDAVVSGLPFAAFPVGLQTAVLDAVAAAVCPDGGVFTTFNYVGAYSMPAAKRFRALLAERFAEITISRPVMRNLPPAHVLTARRVRV
ncbi:phospholipid N-methyltransferase [Stackebrandtia albiflava]|uniref:Phospholipid N-methyltransferase n=1 Tax=Stackebrandtia albiflava TaxID=406432 RepID=A0A562V3E8_9ACTN|nr:rRNA adenine N-6-methyltransferase family protein [Stackebrandtia albiflava]TWJ12383.1 phospholipid N-methyltransferase [Stackebrandtia albiflava]